MWIGKIAAALPFLEARPAVEHKLPAFAAANRSPARGKDRESRFLLEACLNAVYGGQISAPRKWDNFLRSCRENQLDWKEIVGGDQEEPTLLEEVLMRNDWQAARYIWSQLPDGLYSSGCVERSSLGLFISQSGHRDGPCLYFPPNGGCYMGEMKMGRREGVGEIRYPLGGRYIGEWKDDVKQGLGRYHTPAQKTPLACGFWQNDVFQHETIDTLKKFNKTKKEV